ncbi:hypothetical protein MP638_003246 [Amoeboaphelidium occidentale]|nr:hypothetical protein MP638_003246 [Amoeboaphelidium occidentale]
MVKLEPVESCKLGFVEQVWTKSRKYHENKNEFMISTAIEFEVQHGVPIDHALFDRVFRKTCAKQYRMSCCIGDHDDELKLAAHDVADLKLNLDVKYDAEGWNEDFIKKQLAESLSTLYPKNNSDLLWGSVVYLSGNENENRLVKINDTDEPVKCCMFISFNHILTDGFGAMFLVKLILEELAAEVRTVSNGTSLNDHPVSQRILCRPPLVFEDHIVPETCSFVPAVLSMRHQSYDVSDERFCGHKISGNVQKPLLNHLDSFKLSKELTAKFVAACKKNKTSVSAGVTIASMCAGRNVSELNKGPFEPADDNQGFILPCNGRYLMNVDVPHDNCLANYFVNTMTPNYAVTDTDQFWVKAQDIRDFWRSDSRNFKGRLNLFTQAMKGGMIDAQMKQFGESYPNMPRTINVTLSSLGVLGNAFEGLEKEGGIKITDTFAALGSWSSICASKFNVMIATLGEGGMKIVVTAPKGVITDHEFNVYVKVLKRVLERVSSDQTGLLTVYEVRR